MFFNSLDCNCKSPVGAVAEGERVAISFYVPEGFYADRVSVVLQYGDPGRCDTLPLDKAAVLDDCAVYRATISTEGCVGLIWYYFVLEAGGSLRYCGDSPRQRGGEGHLYSQVPPAFRMTVYARDFATPDWFCEGPMYQIFPDRFCADNPQNPEGKYIHASWDELPHFRPDERGKITNSDFFGGNLQGICKKLPYLASLSVKTIYLNPICRAASNHRYDTGDYHLVDPMLGTNEDFAALCRAAHALDMRVILDGVFSHTGDDSLYFNKYGNYPSLGAYQSEQSPYAPWFTFENRPDKYRCWWGIDTLPEVRKDCPSFIEFIITGENSVVRHWLKLGADGFRLDVADELPDEFIELLRRVIKEQKPDALLLGEVWEDAVNKISYGKRRRYLYGGALDGVMNYPLRDALIAFLQSGYAEHFVEAMQAVLCGYPPPALRCLMNFLSTHDTVRILNVLGYLGDSGHLGREGRARFVLPDEARQAAVSSLKLGAVILYGFIGVPSIYYGDEVGLDGFEDPFNRKPYPYGKEDAALLEFFRRLGAIRRDCAALTRGDLRFLWGHMDALCFARTWQEQEVLVVANRGVWSYRVPLPGRRGAYTDLVSGEVFLLEDGFDAAPQRAYILAAPEAARGHNGYIYRACF